MGVPIDIAAIPVAEFEHLPSATLSREYVVFTNGETINLNGEDDIAVIIEVVIPSE